jgi:hypothetical protein
MTLESLAAVQARIAYLSGRSATPAASARTAAATAATTAAAGGEFQALLNSAMGTTGTAAMATSPMAGASTLRSSRSLTPTSTSGPLTPPAELVAYGNGRIPPEALTPIGVGSHRLYGPAAEAFQQLLADASAAGIEIGVTDSYRTYESQVDLARRKGLYSQGGLAATPGTSNHGWGLSVDLDLNASAQAWMRQNGARYGFVEDVPREPWHWTFRAL